MPFLEAQDVASKQLNYTELKTQINAAQSDSISTIYANLYLNKAKKDKDRIKMAKGYDFLLEINSHTLTGLKYADSIIRTTKILNTKKYPAEGYLKKGIQLYYLARHKEALENYVIAYDYFENHNNTYGKVSVNHYIALLKNNINEEKEALNLLKQNLLFFDNKKNQNKHKRQYLKSLFALVDSYNRNKVFDSAEIVAKTGILESLKTEDKYLYSGFLLSFGATKIFKKEYDIALDSLIKGSKLLKAEKRVLAGSYDVISTAYFRKKEPKKAIVYLHKIDSLYQDNPEIIFQAKGAYEILIREYQKENDVNNQLTTIKKLLKVDSIINIKHNDLSKNIVKEYETPLLISEKERLIKALKKESLSNKRLVFCLVIISLVILLIMFYVILKNKAHKKRFDALIEQQNKKIVDPIKEIQINNKDYDFPEDIVNDIISKLEKFETSNSYITKHYALNTLAKEFNTNSAYLSKVINATKKVNFSNYLNNLKIDYAINKLTKGKQLRSYTIKAIAEEVGFNNAQSFTNAFNKKTGLFPSYFIKQLNKKEKTQLNTL